MGSVFERAEEHTFSELTPAAQERVLTEIVQWLLVSPDFDLEAEDEFWSVALLVERQEGDLR
jgi:hypothetical protein